MTTDSKQKIIIAGAGPAGLTAAAELAEKGANVTVLEKETEYVGGIARTVHYNGFRFDIGGHRFFSKSEEVSNWWKKRLPENEFLRRKRLSRIFYRGKFFNYPLKSANALLGLGVWTSFLCVLSYMKARLFPIRPEKSLADWVSNRFGARLFNIFFKTYTEKVWGIPCTELSADWAAQRIKGLSLVKAIVTALFPQRGHGKKVVKTLIDQFDYPRLGPGMMWEKTRDDILAAGHAVEMRQKVVRIRREGNRILSIITCDADGREREWQGDSFIISIPLRETVQAFDPPLPDEAMRAAERLSYRDFLTIALMVKRIDLFPDNWIYIHDPAVRMGRIQDFNNWSPHLVPDASTHTCLGLEYFCNEGDDLWTMADSDLVELGKTELQKLGLVQREDVVDGAVVRMEKAYPVYSPHYQEDVEIVRKELTKLQNLQVVGRNGMHKYNNQDHSMMTGLLAARNILQQQADDAFPFNLWNVNTDAEYHEEKK